MAVTNDELILFLTLAKRARKERSMYARLLFQENILSALIIVTLHTIADYLNTAVTTSVLTDQRSFRSMSVVKIVFDSDDLEGKTLGQLCGVLYPFLNRHKSLQDYLKDFVKCRNKISHKMLKYKSINELEKDSQKAAKLGEIVRSALNEFRRSLQSRMR
jgi:hypothetical protein